MREAVTAGFDYLHGQRGKCVFFFIFHDVVISKDIDFPPRRASSSLIIASYREGLT